MRRQVSRSAWFVRLGGGVAARAARAPRLSISPSHSHTHDHRDARGAQRGGRRRGAEAAAQRDLAQAGRVDTHKGVNVVKRHSAELEVLNRLGERRERVADALGRDDGLVDVVAAPRHRDRARAVNVFLR